MVAALIRRGKYKNTQTDAFDPDGDLQTQTGWAAVLRHAVDEHGQAVNDHDDVLTPSPPALFKSRQRDSPQNNHIWLQRILQKSRCKSASCVLGTPDALNPWLCKSRGWRGPSPPLAWRSSNYRRSHERPFRALNSSPDRQNPRRQLLSAES